jgi:hypothetical protein
VNSATKLLLISSLAFLTECLPVHASLIYTYDFQGSPGSGLAVDQANGQPANATMSDYTRNGGLNGTGASDVFGSKGWANGGALDPSIFTAFTITSDPGFVLSLSKLSFDSLKNGAQTLNAEVDLFLDGSTTAYASFAWTPQNAPMTSYTFNFTPVMAADNVTTATFKFFVWNATATNEVQFDNVAIFGGVNVPEAASLGPITLVIGFAISMRRELRGGRSKRTS